MDRPTPKSAGGHFEPSVDPVSGRVMNTDPEYKILDAIATDLGPYGTDVRGTLYLYSEMDLCESCFGVMDQFKAKFPNIEVHVITDHPYPYSK
ncbi:MAG TPA: deaminase domain-containing protein [Bryobacteraceae bacterium]|jgi:hypothetical protein